MQECKLLETFQENVVLLFCLTELSCQSIHGKKIKALHNERHIYSSTQDIFYAFTI